MVNSELVEMPNMFNLVGRRCVMVGLQLNGIDGKASMSYHDEYEAHDFHGDDIVHDSTQLGELYTVVLRTMADAGTVTFTLVVPPVNIAGSHHVETFGIRALHRVPGRISEGAAVLGQTQTYRTVRLWGTASQVHTLAPAAASAS